MDFISHFRRRVSHSPSGTMDPGLRGRHTLLLLFGADCQVGVDGSRPAVVRGRRRLHARPVLHGQVFRHIRRRRSDSIFRPVDAAGTS